MKSLFKLFLSSLFVANILAITCPSGSVLTPNENICIYAVNQSQAFPDVIKKCESLKGKPAEVKNIFENSFLLSIFSSSIGGSIEPYIGVVKLPNGTWAYEDGRSIWYTNWDINEPKNSTTTNCVVMNIASGRWKSADCSTPRPSFCMIDYDKTRFLLFIIDRCVEGQEMIADDNDGLQDIRKAIATSTSYYQIDSIDIQEPTTIVFGDTVTGFTTWMLSQEQIESSLEDWDVIDWPNRLAIAMTRIEEIINEFDFVYKEYDYVNAFFVTKRQGIDGSVALASVRTLQQDQGFKFLSIGYGISVDQLSIWGDTITVNSVDEFVAAVIKFNQGSNYPYNQTRGLPKSNGI